MIDKEELVDLGEDYVKSVIAKVSNISAYKLDTQTPFQELGIDSFHALKIVKVLEGDFGALPKTLLFENFNIGDLARYLVDRNATIVSTKCASHVRSHGAGKVIGETRSEPGNRETSVSLGSSSGRNANNNEIAFTLVKLPKIIHIKNLENSLEDQRLVNELYTEYKTESAVSRGTRNIAPYLFLGGDRKGYFNIGFNGKIVLAYSYTGPGNYFEVLAAELYTYSTAHSLDLVILSDLQLQAISSVKYTATPFGAIQRIGDLDQFSLDGKKMRRLRYQVSKFEKSGNCKFAEYICGTSSEVDENIVAVIDRWCEGKTMVNPLVGVAKEDIKKGSFSREHRVFLTYLDDQLQNVIIISPYVAPGDGYLMDLEFYPPEMPLGGLEYAIAEIIKILASEGCTTLSLGATLGPKLACSANADPELDVFLDAMREQNIFNDQGNLQFKNKFRPENDTIFLCKPEGSGKAEDVTDVIMMIADPDENQPDLPLDTEAFRQATVARSRRPDKPVADNSKRVEEIAASTKATCYSPAGERSNILSQYQFDVQQIPAKHVEWDLKTDSWAQLASPYIENQTRYYYENLHQNISLDEELRKLFPQQYFALADSGRSIEYAFCKAFQKKGIVLQNLLFPTTIFHQIGNDFEPIEIPNTSIFDIADSGDCRAELNLDELRTRLNQNADQMAFVCVELANNASGGCPVSVKHLREIRVMLEQASVPLVIDATRILENAYCEVQHNEARQPEGQQSQASTLWKAVWEIATCADVIVASLTKDIGVTKGGIILSNDLKLINRVKDILKEQGKELDAIDRKVIALALGNTKKLAHQVSRRIKATHKLHSMLKQYAVPLVESAPAHCVVINVSAIAEFSVLENAAASFIAWLYLATGIRATEHNVGMQKGSAINGLVRLAVPLGMDQSAIEVIAQKISSAFAVFHNIPDLIQEKIGESANGEYAKRYSLKQYINPAPPQTELPASGLQTKSVVNDDRNPEIAIVGVAGRYPKAKNMQEMWANLAAGKDCIEEISFERLSKRWKNGFAEKYRGGFIDDIDKFDSLFFNISPREAEMLDPQERLFLETAWEALEDAGYHPETVCGENGVRNVGVFVGAVWAMYQIIGVEEKLIGKNTVPNSFFWSIANRVSYWMDFSGPSLTLDTACSSSLTAINLACESIYKGECSAAIVGGVNLDIHQRKLDINTAGGTQSVDGVCRSFGKGANGYVAGEGVGAILLKPLNRAIQDRDNIYGVIKGVVVNHGGKTSGYAVPSPKAQASLIQSALTKANIDARTIGYIEAHGTGTELGDPIEIDGLTRAFDHWKVDKQTCAIGSVKSNIGHLEATAGIVGVCKTLLQMRHKKLAPSLHSKELNEHIDFPGTPFYVVQELQDWHGKEVDGIKYPLRAGVSSFGAGGANAHIILEEFPAEEGVDIKGGQIVPLSARSESQLREMARSLKSYLQASIATENSSIRFTDVVFTLQYGRKTFEHRLVLIADSVESLIQELETYEKGASSDNLIVGSAGGADSLTRLLSKREKQEFINLLLQQRDARRLAQLWIEGLLNDWQGLPGQIAGKRISLPTYPFADKRHWACGDRSLLPLSPKGKHPLIDSNESTFEKQLFRKTFSESDFFIYDHLVSGIPTLPGVAYLELARKAGEVAAGKKVRKIINIVWVSPLTVERGKSTEAYIELRPSGELVQFEVYSEDTASGNKRIYAQGKLAYWTELDSQQEEEYLDLSKIRSRCRPINSGTAAYPLFHQLGLNLGKSFQVLGDISKSDNEVLGALAIPQHLQASFDDFVLHPSLVDGSFQAGMGAALGEKAGQMFVPYSIGEVEILFPLEQNCLSYITEGKEDKKGTTNLARSNVYIVNEAGKVLVKIRDSVGVPLVSVHEKPTTNTTGNTSNIIGNQDAFSRLYYTDYWYEKSPSSLNSEVTNERLVLVFDVDGEINLALRNKFATSGQVHRVIQVKPAEKYRVIDEFTYALNSERIEDYKELFSSLCSAVNGRVDLCFAWTCNKYNLTEYRKKDTSQILQRGVFAFTKLYQALIELNLEKRVNTVYFYRSEVDKLKALNAAMSAFIKTLKIEHPKASCKLVECCNEGYSDHDLATLIDVELGCIKDTDVNVRYKSGLRFVNSLEKIELVNCDKNGVSLVKKGVYLITGGAGGLGLIFAEFLAKQYQATVILTGRSQVNALIESRVAKLNQMGSVVEYIVADIARLKDVRHLLEHIKSTYGKVNGIIHSAGVLRDALLRNKTVDEMRAVFAPKIYGTCFLDEVTKNEKLDFFVVFSSMAGVAGNMGQLDYAYANHFMDVFAHERQHLVNSGRRHGKTLSLNWSIWADGGMQLDEQTEIFFRKNLGIKPIENETGTDALVQGLASTRVQFAVVEGVQSKVEQAWGIAEKIEANDVPVQDNVPTPVASEKLPQAAGNSSDAGELIPLVQEALSQLVIDFLKLDPDDISLDRILLELGFDSITLASFANLINDRYGLDLTPVVFFEYQSIREVANHLVEEFEEVVSAVHGFGGKAEDETSNPDAGNQYQNSVIAESAKSNVVAFNKGWRPGEALTVTSVRSADQKEFTQNRFARMPIAIVGIGGVMPLSDNLEEFWQNLKDEKNLISVIPEDRWRWQDYDGDPLKEQNKSNSKWGGFMREVDKFDPLFFGISPKEAELMDPQQRIFLQTVWQAIEDSGHRISDLAGTKTGLFVGVATNDYLDTLSQHKVPVHAYTSTGNSHSILANRVSFLLDIHGPSAPLDTACSSSLVATHRALESLHSGSCEMAIVGGVQVMTSPGGYIAFGQAGMLSSDGKCKTFDKRANGYVRGEGSGAIFLKPLAKAEADGNPIYAVIKSTAENHGGSAAALTAPNPTVQAELLIEAYEKAQIDPTTVGFIECHGTGTSLGDPIEIQALKKAFGELYKKHNKPKAVEPHCGLSSVKTNIGHLETAAGIAGILKAVLAIKNKAIPALIHFEELNPYIDLTGSPFYIVNRTTPWPAPQSTSGASLPRRAGISSFGFGGAYAHVVLEEYLNPDDLQRENPEKPQREPEGANYIFILSAKNEQRLRDYAGRLLEYLNNEHLNKRNINLTQLAYTLQVGRDEMDYRLALVTGTLDDLKSRLHEFFSLDKRQGLHVQKIDKKKLKEAAGSAGETDRIESLIQHGNLEELAGAWVAGTKINWQKLYSLPYPRRLSLPGYPFARESYWVPQSDTQQHEDIATLKASVLHPLVHKNISSLMQQKFQSHFSGTEFFFSDHVVETQKILPGVAYMEMARVAAEHSFEARVRYIRNLVWKRPITIEDSPKFVEILLTPLSESEVEFSVQTLGKEFTTINCNGVLTYWESDIEPRMLDIAAIKARCQELVITAKDLYQRLFDLGLRLGKSFQIVEKIFATEHEALAILRLPEQLQKQAANYILHPALMDGSLHTAVGLMLKSRMDVPLSLPYSVGEVEILGDLKNLYYGYATWAHGGQVDEHGLIKANIQLLDKEGRLLVSIKDFMSKPLANTDRNHPEKTRHADLPANIGVSHYVNEWKQIPHARIAPVEQPQTILLFDHSEVAGEGLRRIAEHQWRVSPRLILVKTGPNFVRLSSDSYSVNPEKPEQYAALLKALIDEGNEPDAIVYNWSLEQAPENFGVMDEVSGLEMFSLHYLCQALIKLARPGADVTGSRKTTKLISTYTCVVGSPKPHGAALTAYLKSVATEYSRLEFKVVEMTTADDQSSYVNEWIANILNELYGGDCFNSLIKYRDGKRFQKQIAKINLSAGNQSPIKNNGTYLITGGMGGLGSIFANYFCREANANVILVGRSKLSEEKQNILHSMQREGCKLEYVVADVTHRESVNTLLHDIKARFGTLNGLIHAAGIVRDALVVNKPVSEMAEVFSAKITGTLNLDFATKAEPLDFFAVFSSVTSVLGNAGQADYAYANSFMDEYIEYRNSLSTSGERGGLSVTLNWPLWKEGGMQIDGALQDILQKTTGLIPLSTAAGIDTFFAALSNNLKNVIVFEGDLRKVESILREKFGLVSGRDIPENTKAPIQIIEDPSRINSSLNDKKQYADETSAQLLDLLKEDLFKLVNSTLGIRKENFDQDIDMIEYGLDSISLSKFFSDVNNRYKIDLTPAMFFEYPTFNAISKYIASEYNNDLSHYFGDKIQVPVTPLNSAQVSVEHVKNATLEKKLVPQKKWQTRGLTQRGSQKTDEQIVVVGLGCVMPQSRNAEEFWSNLLNENNLISEIPADRWDWREFEGDPVSGINKTNSRWGGFIPDVDKFDAAFFGISPFEAELMDPQQRIFLQTVWHAIDDAGHAVSDLSGTKTGIFVGVGGHDYLEVLRESQTNIVAYASTGNTHSVLANRISFLLNLHGPSEPVDTACSASLVALNRAVEAIRTGSCEMAIAGGVNVILSPGLYLAFGNAGMLASDGKCKTFDKSADGYVRGEGAGAVFLKKLGSALRDGNHIYGLIKNSGVNHGGHATALTAPNPNAQAELIIETYRKADVDPDTVTYIEAHGTGTSLGDPVEINGLKKAFKALARKQNSVNQPGYCGLGSVKTNIGHLETAAGIASLIKVLLALKHRKLPATLHQDELNPHIRLDGSPFFIVNTTRDWRTTNDQQGNPLPRRAGVSSFGFGGANAHVLVEEYLEKSVPRENKSGGDEMYLIPLSAKTEEQLVDVVRELLQKLQKQDFAVAMDSLAYTLQVGRDAREYRAAVVTGSVKELCLLLEACIRGDDNVDNLYIGSVQTKHKEASVASLDNDIKETIVHKLVSEKRLQKLAALWVNGLEVNWRIFYPGESPKRISLPGYPFARTRHWIPTNPAFGSALRTRINHPLVHANSSDISVTRFTSRFSGKEPFLVETQVDCERKGKDIVCFPHILALEMALSAVRQSVLLDPDSHNLQIHNVLWQGSHRTDKNTDINIELFANGDINDPYGQIDFDIHICTEGRQRKFCEGQAVYLEKEKEFFVDINALVTQLSEEHLDTKLVFSSIEKLGINFKEDLYGVLDIYRGRDQLLVSMRIPDTEVEQYDLPPCVLEGITNACFLQARMDFDSAIAKNLFPVSLQSLSVNCSLNQEIYIWVSSKDPDSATNVDFRMFDVVVLDPEGRCCAQFRGLCFNTSNSHPSKNPRKQELLDLGKEVVTLFSPVWDEFKILESNPDKDSQNVLIINAGKETGSAFRDIFKTVHQLELDAEDGIEGIYKKLEKFRFNRVIWLAPDFTIKNLGDENIIRYQERGIYQLLRLVKTLIKAGYERTNLILDLISTSSLKIASEDNINPTHAGLNGFTGALAGEFPAWKVNLFDCDVIDTVNIVSIAGMQRDSGAVYACRQREWFFQNFVEIVNFPEYDDIYVNDGVYVVVGGSGGLGELWSRFVVDHYQARVVWIGRRPRDEVINKKLSSFNNSVEYIQADATKFGDLSVAHKKIKEKYERINGVVHSAVGVFDESIKAVSEDKFRDIISVKVDVSVRLAQVFEKENLDFILFFSSGASFSRLPGMSGYSAGCGFKDVFSNQLSRLWKSKVKVINWGYWATGTGEAFSDLMKSMVYNSGQRPLGPAEGMHYLKLFLGSPLPQVAVIKTLLANKFDIGFSASKFKLLEKSFAVLDRGRLMSLINKQEVPSAFSPSRENDHSDMENILYRLLLSTLNSVVPDKIIPRYSRWLEESQNFLQRFKSENSVVEEDLASIWEQWEKLKQDWLSDDMKRPVCLLIEKCMRALPEILVGRVRASDIVFENSSLTLVEGFYRSPVAKAYNSIMAVSLRHVVCEILRNNPEEKIRILEIGAGTGATSTDLFEVLDEFRENMDEYLYTDVSNAFLLHAQNSFGKRVPYLKTSILNIEIPLSEQSVVAGSYHIVIAANVLHATKNIRTALRNVKATMKNGGCLLLNEVSDRSIYAHLIFGLMEGWWLSEDEPLRIKGSPALYPASWFRVLSNEGFYPVEFPLVETHKYGQQIVVAVSDGVVRNQVSDKWDASEMEADVVDSSLVLET